MLNSAKRKLPMTFFVRIDAKALKNLFFFAEEEETVNRDGVEKVHKKRFLFSGWKKRGKRL